MKELTIERLEGTSGGCSMEEMLFYAFQSNYYASIGNYDLSIFYGARLMGCI
ncbi:MAG: hypothetical protein P8O16_08650 [Algoriphagus sp.]|uniref:hypothetical protein n=1 Tax=Algoriphagus sp. TaxID=1872435 RepID=UPI0026068AC9|nr:hypothetical protein [Algoriphagus sp.]MDG1277335.1 hypothetical protein [Algoriphagus sp.]|tara:strand:+ start:282 stop:437 length:156 start_codon:yes stop_codon:yes gene_type:complete